jgi:GNAT superfamily N-acetyltransferase
MPAALKIRAIAPTAAYPLRHQVLWPDKPLDYVKVENDEAGQHFGAFLAERLVAVISLFVEGEDARFRKFATDPAQQRRGIGNALLRYVMVEAQRQRARRLWCDARQDSAAFYVRFGLRPEGAEFFKGPIPYVRMAREL